MKKNLQTYYWKTIGRILIFLLLGLINGCYTTKHLPVDKTRDTIDNEVVITALTKQDGTRIKYHRKSGVNYIVRNDTLIAFTGVDTLLREPASDFVSLVQIEYLTQQEVGRMAYDVYRTFEAINIALAVVGGVILTIALIAILV